MRSKICNDGQYRIAAKVEVLVDINDITQFALAHPTITTSNNPINDFENLNKRQLFSLAKDTIRLFGVAHPASIVTKYWSDNQQIRAYNHVQTLFPEIK